jgi:hypothetical protein
LVDALGRVVFSGKNIGQQDFSGLADGVYFLKGMAGQLRVVKGAP